MHVLPIAILASGNGTTLQAIIDAVASQSLSVCPQVVITNNSGSGAARRARTHGIPLQHLSSHTHPDSVALDAALCTALCESKAELVVLAGYMKKLGQNTLNQFRGRVINTHPSLLPRFGGHGMYGNRVHAAVLEAKESQTGISIHFVDGEYDTGPVLARTTVPVIADDTVETLAARVQAAERPFLIETLQKIADGTIPFPGLDVESSAC